MASAVRSRKKAGKRPALGKGLGALMSSTQVVPVEEEASSADVEIVSSRESSGRNLSYLSLDELYPNESQPRKFFRESEIVSLSNSIKETGVLQPILVRKKESASGGGYEIVAGERRYRASKKAGLKEVPVLIRELTDRETLEIGVVENVQREDLNPIEEALAYRRLVEEFEASQSEIAKTVGKDRASVANSLRLLKLEPGIQELIVEGRITAGHGRALLSLGSFSERRELVERILEESLSVRATERAVSGEKSETVAVPRVGSSKKTVAEKSPAVLELEERFRRALGTKVNLSFDNKTGRGDLRVSFFSAEELQNLLDRFGA